MIKMVAFQGEIIPHSLQISTAVGEIIPLSSSTFDSCGASPRKLSFPRRRKTSGYQYLIALFFFLSCGRRDIPINPDPATNVQQTPTETGQNRDTPLHQAILVQTDLASLYTFLQPTSINKSDNEGNTPLHRAVIQDNLPLVGLLLSAKANIDAQNTAGLTPLHLAAKQGNLLTLHLLLIYQADIHAKDKEGRTPLDYINEKQHTDQLQQILQRTPWDAIASERDPFVVAWLLAAQKTRTKDSQGWTPLHLAACLGHREAMQDLIANKADIEVKNAQGWTPLHLAAFLGQLEAVQLLLDHQASTDAIDHKGRTPYDIAESAAVKELLGSRMNLGKLIFDCNYDQIGKRILDNLASEDSDEHLRPFRTLRETSPKMGWGLLQQGRVVLQVPPDKLPDLQPHRYAGLYPHAQTSHCVCPIFDPIPADAVVRGEVDWQSIAKNKHLSIKNVVFKGEVEALELLRAVLPLHLIDHFIVPKEILEEELTSSIEYSPESISSSSDDEEEQQVDEAEGSGQEKYPPANQKEVDDQAEGIEQEQTTATIIDPENQLYNSFVGVKKLAAGKVTIEKSHIAAGTFGKVFRGQWGDRLVALKQINLRHALDKLKEEVTYEDVEEAMQWEVARLSTTNHPNLVQFYGLYQDGNEGYSYMVMEFCDGGTLQGALEKKDVPWCQRWQWALQISEALAYLHQEGVLHRDLKAENILLDRNGTAKLADLGVAQVDALLQEKVPQVVEIGLQDKRFIAPEVETDPTLSTKETDIYALGLVF